MQSGPRGSDMSNIPLSLSTWEHKNEEEFPIKTPPPISTLPASFHTPQNPSTNSSLGNLRLCPLCNKAFHERKHFLRRRHLLVPRYKTVHFSSCLSVSLLCLASFSNHSLPLSSSPFLFLQKQRATVYMARLGLYRFSEFPGVPLIWKLNDSTQCQKR